MFEPLHSLNFSIGGDQTQNLLWRICNGELDNMELKVCNYHNLILIIYFQSFTVNFSKKQMIIMFLIYKISLLFAIP